MSVLRTELRRSTGPAAGVLTAALGLAGLYTLVMSDQSELWDAQWTLLASFQRIMLVVLWPLALGAGAWQARRDRRTNMAELAATTPRPVWRRALPTSAALAIWLVLAYLVTFAAGAVRVAGSTDYPNAGWVPIVAVGALSLVAAGWLGMGIGRLLPSAHTPPILVIAGFLALLVPVQLSKSAEPSGAALLPPNLSTTLDEFTTIAGRVDLARAVVLAGLAVGGLLLVMVARRKAAVIAIVPVVLSLAVAVPLVNAAPAGGVQADPGAVAEVCTTDGGPEVCVTTAHAKGLASLTGPARKALTLLAKLPNAPTSVREVTGERPQPAGEAWLHSDNYQPGRGWLDSGDALVVRILAGAGTRPCDPIDYRTRALAAAWLFGQYPAPGQRLRPGEEAAGRDAAWQTLRALPETQQRQRIAEIRTAGLTCHGDS